MCAVRFFRIPATVVFGDNACHETGEQAKKQGAKKVLLVTDARLVAEGLHLPLVDSLRKAGIGCEVFDEIATEPTVEYVCHGLNVYKEADCDMIIALGGGSVIDTGKAVAVLTANPGGIADYQGIDRLHRPGCPLIAVPTTAGTGSEVTAVSIITDSATDVKMLLISPYLIPTVALVDPALTTSVPPEVTAATGIDALTHAIEAYVSVRAHPLSDLYALSAIGLIGGNLRQAWANGNNAAARRNVMLGSFQAGVAFSNSSVALVHGMSRPIGAYFHVPHGLSNAVLLPTVMEFSAMGAPERYCEIAHALGENIEGYSPMDAALVAVDAVASLVIDIGIPSMAEVGVNRERLENVVERMAADALASGSPGNNPRSATKEQIIGLYWEAYEDESG